MTKNRSISKIIFLMFFSLILFGINNVNGQNTPTSNCGVGEKESNVKEECDKAGKQFESDYCCVEVPNCSGEGEYGTRSGGAGDRACKPCPDGEKPNSDKTACICDSSKGCCGVELNTVIPFIGDCIEFGSDGGDSSDGNTSRVTALNAFPKLMGALSKILVTAILIFSFVMIVVGGVMMVSGGIDKSYYEAGKKHIGKVIMALILLGVSGIILRLINPNFFG